MTIVRDEINATLEDLVEIISNIDRAIWCIEQHKYVIREFLRIFGSEEFLKFIGEIDLSTCEELLRKNEENIFRMMSEWVPAIEWDENVRGELYHEKTYDASFYASIVEEFEVYATKQNEDCELQRELEEKFQMIFETTSDV